MDDILKKLVFLLLLSVIFSCESKSETEQEIEKIPVELKVVRFDEKFAEATPESLPKLEKEFPFLFPENVADSVWMAKINDTLQQALNREVVEAFPNFSEEEDDIRQLFQHLKYYFPKFSEPTVITLTSEVDYRNRIIVTDSLLLISLDVYLGKAHEFYEGVYPYLRQDFESELMVSDIAGEYAKKFVPMPKSRSFLAQMVYHGKILYLKDVLIPFKSDAQKIRYSEDQLQWAEKNEEEIWRYFVEKQLLYSTQNDLQARFIDIGPYSKFYLQLDSESPAQLGRYMGWQIVRQFMEKNENVSLEELLSTDAKTIFDRTNYKPAR